MKEKILDFFYDSYKNGYNSTSGGRSGYEFTEEILYKMGSGNRGKKQSEEEIEKRISPLRGRKQSTIEIENRAENFGERRELLNRGNIFLILSKVGLELEGKQFTNI